MLSFPHNCQFVIGYLIFNPFICLGTVKEKSKKKKAFDFGLDESTENLVDKQLEAETDITAFLRKACATDRNDFAQLHQHSFIAELFKKFNAICTSSAPSERLFSIAGMFIQYCYILYKYAQTFNFHIASLFDTGLIMEPKRRCMSDDIFEQLLLLKTNHTF